MSGFVATNMAWKCPDISWRHIWFYWHKQHWCPDILLTIFSCNTTTISPSTSRHETNIHVMWTWYDAYCRNVQWVHMARTKLTSILVLQKCKAPTFYSGDWAVEGHQSKSFSSGTSLQPAHFSLCLNNCDTGDRAKCLRQVLLQSSLSNQWAAESLSTANLPARTRPPSLSWLDL